MFICCVLYTTGDMGSDFQMC